MWRTRTEGQTLRYTGRQWMREHPGTDKKVHLRHFILLCYCTAFQPVTQYVLQIAWACQETLIWIASLHSANSNVARWNCEVWIFSRHNTCNITCWTVSTVHCKRRHPSVMRNLAHELRMSYLAFWMSTGSGTSRHFPIEPHYSSAPLYSALLVAYTL